MTMRTRMRTRMRTITAETACTYLYARTPQQAMRATCAATVRRCACGVRTPLTKRENPCKYVRTRRPQAPLKGGYGPDANNQHNLQTTRARSVAAAETAWSPRTSWEVV